MMLYCNSTFYLAGGGVEISLVSLDFIPFIQSVKIADPQVELIKNLPDLTWEEMEIEFLEIERLIQRLIRMVDQYSFHNFAIQLSQ